MIVAFLDPCIKSMRFGPVEAVDPKLRETLFVLNCSQRWRVVSRKRWKFPGGLLRACEGSVS